MDKPLWHKRLMTGPFRTQTVSQRHIQLIESRVQTRKVKNRLRIVGILAAAAILIIIFLMVPQLTSNKQAGSFTMMDIQTPEQLSHVSPYRQPDCL